MTSRPAPFTLRTAAGLPSEAGSVDASVLVVIDAQREYTTGLLPLAGVDAAVDNIGRLLDAARSSGRPVVHVMHQGQPGGAFDRQDGGRAIETLMPRPDELVVAKTLPNAFAGTTLLKELKQVDASHLLIVGFMTHMCVSTTARSALDHGLANTVLADGTATRDLPGVNGEAAVESGVVQAAALAALADRFSVVTTIDAVLRETP